MAINKEWHEKNRMPKNATFEERVKWHKEHNKKCSCHPGFPKKLEEEMKKDTFFINKLLYNSNIFKLYCFMLFYATKTTSRYP